MVANNKVKRRTTLNTYNSDPTSFSAEFSGKRRLQRSYSDSTYELLFGKLYPNRKKAVSGRLELLESEGDEALKQMQEYLEITDPEDIRDYNYEQFEPEVDYRSKIPAVVSTLFDDFFGSLSSKYVFQNINLYVFVWWSFYFTEYLIPASKLYLPFCSWIFSGSLFTDLYAFDLYFSFFVISFYAPLILFFSVYQLYMYKSRTLFDFRLFSESFTFFFIFIPVGIFFIFGLSYVAFIFFFFFLFCLYSLVQRYFTQYYSFFYFGQHSFQMNSLLIDSSESMKLSSSTVFLPKPEKFTYRFSRFPPAYRKSVFTRFPFSTNVRSIKKNNDFIRDCYFLSFKYPSQMAFRPFRNTPIEVGYPATFPTTYGFDPSHYYELKVFRHLVPISDFEGQTDYMPDFMVYPNGSSILTYNSPNFTVPTTSVFSDYDTSRVNFASTDFQPIGFWFSSAKPYLKLKFWLYSVATDSSVNDYFSSKNSYRSYSAFVPAAFFQSFFYITISRLISAFYDSLQFFFHVFTLWSFWFPKDCDEGASARAMQFTLTEYSRHTLFAPFYSSFFIKKLLKIIKKLEFRLRLVPTPFFDSTNFEGLEEALLILETSLQSYRKSYLFKYAGSARAIRARYVYLFACLRIINVLKCYCRFRSM